jgi:4-hydroxyphenylpyruvate dioxygenase
VASPTETADEYGRITTSSIAAYGDTIHTFVERGHYNGAFLPGFRADATDTVARPTGLKHVDHMVGNVGWHAMDEWVDFYAHVMGFQLYQHFDDKDISTEYSALMSKVMANGNGYVKFPINEPAEGAGNRRSKSISTSTRAPACSTSRWPPTTFSTVSRMQAQGVEFLTVPHTYYTDLPAAWADRRAH